jgi:hypothetical protein
MLVNSNSTAQIKLNNLLTNADEKEPNQCKKKCLGYKATLKAERTKYTKDINKLKREVVRASMELRDLGMAYIINLFP